MQIPRDANSLPFVKTDEVILQDGTHGVVRELRAPDPGGRLPLVCVDTGSNVQQRLGWYDPRELHVGPRVLARLVAAGPTASMLRNLPARLIVESEPERLAGLAGPEIADVVMALAPTSSQTVDQLFDAVRLLLAA